MSVIEHTERIKPMPTSPRYMSEAEFEAWDRDEDLKAEWVRGEVIIHMPATPKHNLVELWLARLLGFYAEHHALGIVFNAEVEIRVPGIWRVPDICFVTQGRSHIVKHTRIEGAPDLIMEIVSPDSVERDWRDKYLDYQAMGVREYWVIDLDYQRLRAYHLDAEGRYAAIEEQDGKTHSQVLSGFWVRASDLWQDPLPNSMSLLRELGVI